ncbi:hypothetical protein BEP19_12965 [Ammoniphilus oxalaticus]|uniref:Uncharacterized protein n=1 Tax=Ammoniphilus oxalaticus TaxID=66863 RepID=A0A419SHB6_9BACL|nr:hypothetical protein [Ammoniphilus oxalaticus]RKD23125.1 hypothetical protein BEP19_12965 [Ammoniphilus oxalaticus]
MSLVIRKYLIQLCLVIPIAFLGGCSIGTSGGKLETKDLPPILWMTKTLPNDPGKGLVDLYAKRKDEPEPEKLASNIIHYSIEVSEDHQKLLAMDQEENVALFHGEEREKIGSDLYAYEFSLDMERVIYVSEDHGFYVKQIGGEKDKLLSNVISFEQSYIGGPLYVLTDEDDLYRISDSGEKQKIAFDVTDYYVKNQGKTVFAGMKDGSIYAIEDGEERKKMIDGDTQVNPYWIDVSPTGQYVTYVETVVHYEDGRGELYIVDRSSGERKKVASDVIIDERFFDQKGEFIYYRNTDHVLNSYQIKTGDKEKLAEGVQTFRYEAASDTLTYLTKSDELYGGSPGKAIEKITEDTYSFDVAKNGVICFVTADGDLRTKTPGKEALTVAQEVESFELQNNHLFYVTKENKVWYRHAGDTESVVYLDNLENYSKANTEFKHHYGDFTYLYEQEAKLADVEGYWTDHTDYLKFEALTEDVLKVSILDNGSSEWIESVDLYHQYSREDQLFFEDALFTIDSTHVIKVEEGVQSFVLYRMSQGEMDEIVSRQ